MFVKRTRIGAPAAAVFAWHECADALEKLTPPWERVEVLERAGGIENGARVTLRMRVGPVWVRWVAEHRDYVKDRQFCDVQVRGPFRSWKHTHRVIPEGAEACWLEDEIQYESPWWLPDGVVRRRLERAFGYRHELMAREFQR